MGLGGLRQLDALRDVAMRESYRKPRDYKLQHHICLEDSLTADEIRSSRTILNTLRRLRQAIRCIEAVKTRFAMLSKHIIVLFRRQIWISTCLLQLALGTDTES